MGFVAGIDPAKLADAQDVAGKLQQLPKDVLLYIAGYVDGCISKAVRMYETGDTADGTTE